MPIMGNTLPPRPVTASSGSANATTKIQLEDDTHDGVIAAIVFFHEDKRDEETGALVAGDPNLLNMVRVKVMVRNAILSRKMTNSTYKNSNMAKFLAAATGIPVTDEPALKTVDTDTLIGRAIRVDTCYNPQSGYTNIEKFKAPKKAVANVNAAAAPATELDGDDLAEEYAQQQVA